MSVSYHYTYLDSTLFKCIILILLLYTSYLIYLLWPPTLYIFTNFIWMHDLRDFWSQLRVHVKVFTDRILDSDHNRCNFRTELSFSIFSNYRCCFRFRSYRFWSRFREKNMETKMVLVFTDHFRPFSPLPVRSIQNVVVSFDFRGRKI